jgi:hypothetical protein
MESYCTTGLSPQQAVAPTEEEEEEVCTTVNSVTDCTTHNSKALRQRLQRIPDDGT